MARKHSLKKLRKARARFLSLRHPDHLAKLLQVETFRLELMAVQPSYRVFSVPKRNGKKRWIEDPEDRLQEVQSALGFYLGAVYFFLRPPCAFGFVMSAKKDVDPRNVATHAMRHLGATYLFNADMRDFFHQIKTERIFQLLVEPPFRFEDKLADLIAGLVTHQGRLPMGAPTSPVLSNWASLSMDQRLQDYARHRGRVYTRYADDLSFSGQAPFEKEEVDRIKELVQKEHFEFNPDKFRMMGPGDELEVTGVKLGENEIDVPDGFLQELHADLHKLGHLLEVAHRMGRQEKWIDRFTEQVSGKVAFAVFVNGEEDPVSQDLTEKLDRALHPPDEFGSVKWLDFGYF